MPFDCGHEVLSVPECAKDFKKWFHSKIHSIVNAHTNSPNNIHQRQNQAVGTFNDVQGLWLGYWLMRISLGNDHLDSFRHNTQAPFQLMAKIVFLAGLLISLLQKLRKNKQCLGCLLYISQVISNVPFCSDGWSVRNHRIF